MASQDELEDMLFYIPADIPSEKESIDEEMEYDESRRGDENEIKASI